MNDKSVEKEQKLQQLIDVLNGITLEKWNELKKELDSIFERCFVLTLSDKRD
jgi:hypothetical protein